MCIVCMPIKSYSLKVELQADVEHPNMGATNKLRLSFVRAVHTQPLSHDSSPLKWCVKIENVFVHLE